MNKDIAKSETLQRLKKYAPAEFAFLDVTTEIGYLASEITAELESVRQGIGLPDSLIASTAIYHGLTLVTANTGHFLRIVAAGFPLTLENWRESRMIP